MVDCLDYLMWLTVLCVRGRLSYVCHVGSTTGFTSSVSKQTVALNVYTPGTPASGGEEETT